GLALLIPLRVAHMPGVSAIAATSGLIISAAAVTATISANLSARLSRGIPVGQILTAGLLAGGPIFAAMALAEHWLTLLALRALLGVLIGGALTMAYSLGGLIVPVHQRGAAFGWLALGVQIGTALSPLATGGLAAISLPGAFVFGGTVAWLGAALLLFG